MKSSDGVDEEYYDASGANLTRLDAKIFVFSEK